MSVREADLIERLRYASGWESRSVPGVELSPATLLYHDAIDEIERLRAALTAAAADARRAEQERLGFGQIVMMSEQRGRPGFPPRWCALARGAKQAVLADTEEDARVLALAAPPPAPETHLSMDAVRNRLATYKPLGSSARGVAGPAIGPNEDHEQDGEWPPAPETQQE